MWGYMISCSIQLIVETIYQNKAKVFKQNYSATCNTHNEAANRNNSDLPDRALKNKLLFSDSRKSPRSCEAKQLK